ncbi:MAG: hypothetical protein FGM54_05535 [Chitinophagaceae bacterium]|nr:hypothetical protein [Chitinophagaceae bacterium]
MRPFYRNIILFFLLPLIGFGLMELLLRQIPNEYKEKYKVLTKTNNSYNTLILGNSFTYFGINPAWMKTPVYNASQINESIFLHHYKFQLARPHFKNLHTIVVPISFANLRFSKYPDKKLNLLKNYLLYMGLNAPVSIFNYAEVSAESFKENIQRIITFYIKHENNWGSNEGGWGNFYQSEQKLDLVKTTRVRYNTTLRRIKDGEREVAYPSNIQLLNQWMEACREQNIQVIFLYMPVSSVMYQNYNPAQLHATDSIMLRLVQTFPNVQYINFLQSNQFNDQDFYDADHLHDIGAKKMSYILDSILINATKHRDKKKS